MAQQLRTLTCLLCVQVIDKDADGVLDEIESAIFQAAVSILNGQGFSYRCQLHTLVAPIAFSGFSWRNMMEPARRQGYLQLTAAQACGADIGLLASAVYAAAAKLYLMSWLLHPPAACHHAARPTSCTYPSSTASC